MKIKLYKARLRTGSKTENEIISDFEGDVTEKEIQEWIRAYDLVDGIEVVVMDSFLSSGYALASWNKKDDEKLRDFIYQAEQDGMFGTYIDDREGFLKDWNNDEYEPTGTLTFSKNDVEIVEGISTE